MKPRDYAVALVVPLVAAALAHPVFDRIEDPSLQGLSLDLLFSLRSWTAPPDLEPAKSRSVVVALDEKTYRTEPFEGVPKGLWTKELADVMDALIDAGAAVIGFDMILSTSVENSRETVFRRYDRKFRRALKRAADQGKLVLGSATLGQRFLEPLDSYKLIARGNTRSLNIITDDDDVNRHVPLFFRSAAGNTTGNGSQGEAGAGPELVASMSLTLASRLLEVAPRVDGDSVVLDDYKIPARIAQDMFVSIDGARVSLANNMVVDLYRGPSSIPTYSFAALYHCAAAGNEDYFRRHFEGKAVLIGAFLDVEDRKVTSIRFAQRGTGPVAPEPCIENPGPAEDGEAETWERKSIPGVYLHAAAVNNMVLRKVLRPVGFEVHFALMAVMALAIAFCAMTTSSLRSWVALVVGSAAWTAAATAAFIFGWVLPLLAPVGASAVTLFALLGYRFTVTDRLERHIRKSFGRILSPSLVERMVELGQPPTQGGELREITVWISDLENYTTLSELLPPTKLVNFLNEIYSVMSDTIEEYDGYAPQFVGDAVVAAFNVPLDDPDHARHGIEAAMACCDRVAELRETLDLLPPGFNLRIRIGISTGNLLVGFIGSKERLSYSIVGDDINLASRLEGVNKVYGSTILVNEVTKDLCGPDLAFREIDIVRVKGRDTPVRIFEPLGKSADIEEEQDRRLQVFAGALAAFRERRFGAAAAAFESLSQHDPVSGKFAERARDMAADPPPDDWDGVNNLLTK